MAKARGTGISLAILILVNLIPILGFLAFDWEPFRLLLLYWCESAVMIVFAVARVWLVPVRPSMGVEGPIESSSGITPRKVFMSGFLFVHSGVFMMGHLFFLAFLGGLGERRGMARFEAGGALDRIGGVFGDGGALLVLLGFVASHLFSYVYHYWLGGEYRMTTLSAEMKRPYTRIFAMHLAIILGAFGMVLVGLPASSLIVLVVVKTIIDAVAHVRDHRKKPSVAAV